MAGDLDDDDSDEKQPPSRWLEAARYALAMVVTVLIVAVIVHAIKVLLRPDSLSLTVIRGSVFSQRSSTDADVNLNFNLRAKNPSGRSRMYFVGVTVYLFDENTPPSTSNPLGDSIAYNGMHDKAVPQGKAVDAYTEVHIKPESISTNLYFIYKTLYDGGTIAGVTMRVNGSLITEVRSGFNTSARPTTYYCPQLLLGGDPNDEAFKNRQDVPCAQQGGA